MSLHKNIKDLIYFYIKENYDNYLKVNNVKFIHEDKIEAVIHELYHKRKEHIKEFILSALKKMYKPDEYPGDQTIKNIILNIFQDDDYCQNRIIVEIRLYQQKNKDYSKLL
jgi:CRISPR/Cas system-associated exonuclease Cas4 (RecB family)